MDCTEEYNIPGVQFTSARKLVNQGNPIELVFGRLKRIAKSCFRQNTTAAIQAVMLPYAKYILFEMAIGKNAFEFYKWST